MQTSVDERLLDETARYALRYTCESCAHFETGSGACSLGYPNTAHRAVELTVGRKLVYCKEFDLV